MIFSSRFGPVTIVNGPAYTFGSADNARPYAQEYLIPGTDYLSSIHGVLVGASGGASGVHVNAAVVRIA